jgi:hypothetical protein
LPAVALAPAMNTQDKRPFGVSHRFGKNSAVGRGHKYVIHEKELMIKD